MKLHISNSKIKKTILFLSFLFTLTIVSCGKNCHTCKKDLESNKVCESKYDTKEEFESAIRFNELSGYTCN